MRIRNKQRSINEKTLFSSSKEIYIFSFSFSPLGISLFSNFSFYIFSFVSL